jgi:hypothetical protein
MRSLKSLIIFICCISGLISIAQVQGTIKSIPESYCITSMEYKLYSMINAYRQRYDLPPIPLSKSLCLVASEHVNDLFYHHPDQGSCNSHSWSDQGTWKPFCYPRDENKNNSVWDKPKELTSYKGKGYEIVYWENDAAVIDSIIALWKSMDYFNSFLMNTGKWQGKKWNAIGIGIKENYACAWFGELPDPDGEPVICGQEPQKPVLTPLEIKSEPEMKKSGPKVEVKNKNPKIASPDTTKKTIRPVSNIKPETTPIGKENYFIIVKGIAPEQELKLYLKNLQSKGYKNSRLIEKNGKQRVSIMDFKEKSKADSALRQVKMIWPDAWILKQ